MKLVLNTKTTIIDLLSVLLHSRTQTHIFHLQTTSFSEHLALQEYYGKIVDIIDEITETIQGKRMEILSGYKNLPIQEYKNKADLISYFKQLKITCEKYRKGISEDFEYDNVNNQIQIAVDLIEKTIYKLKFLN